MCEALLAAGFRPTVYPEVQFEARSPDFDRDFMDRQEPMLASNSCRSFAALWMPMAST